MRNFNFDEINKNVISCALSKWLSSGAQSDIQASKIAKRAIESIETAFMQEPQNLEGFKFNQRFYELIYQREKGDFEMAVSFYGCGKIIYYIVTGSIYKRGQGSKKIIREVTKEKAITEMTLFFMGAN